MHPAPTPDGGEGGVMLTPARMQEYAIRKMDGVNIDGQRIMVQMAKDPTQHDRPKVWTRAPSSEPPHPPSLPEQIHASLSSPLSPPFPLTECPDKRRARQDTV